MLLRASGKAIDEDVKIEGSVGQGDGGVAHGAQLLRFAEAATRGSEDLGGARKALVEAIGGAAFVEAAATVGIFNGLVRVADATGIPLDDGTQRNSGDFRDALGLNEYGGARNTVASTAADAGPSPSGVAELFLAK